MVDSNRSLQAVEQKTVEFYEDELVAIRASDGHIYVSLRHLCNALGIDAQAQTRRIRRQSVLEKGLQQIPILTPERGEQQAYVIRVDLVPLLLSGISTKAVSEEVRPKLEQFQEEAAKALWEAFQEGRLTADPSFDELLKRASDDVVEAYQIAQAIMKLARNQVVLEELDMECQEKINEDMAYALSYLSIYNNQLNVPKMHREMNNLMIIYGLSDMIYRGMTLVKFYAPNGVMLSEILHSCFCSHYNKTDVEVQQELGIGRTSFYKMKKQALGYLGFYFYEIVVPQAKDKRFKPSLGVEEE